jgi:glutathione S-transferase
MITLYGVTRSRASRNIWLLKELGVPFDQVPVIQVGRVPDPAAADAPLHTKSPAFLAINPNGHVPAMTDGDLMISESLAINLYLARKHGGPLWGETLAEEGLIYHWTLWAATEVEPIAIQILYNRVMRPPEQRDPAAAEQAIASLKAPFKVLNDALIAGGGMVVGRRFTVADINLSECVRYAAAAPELLGLYPAIQDWIAACHARPAFKTMWAARDAEPV